MPFPWFSSLFLDTEAPELPCRRLKAHPWSWMHGRACAERQPRGPLSAEHGTAVCLPPSQGCREGCCFPGSTCCLAPLPQAPRRQALGQGGSPGRLTELLEGCTETYSAEGGQFLPTVCTFSAREVSVHWCCARFCWGGVCFLAASSLRSALPSRQLALLHYPLSLH